ncbi:MAG: molecular chaperone DnaJ [Candidatus Dependentiae bacterium]|nr:molecular chaperone DnaJ [Candidatus Dependentiae bacterium]
MSNKKDFYKILGVEKTASAAEIKKAYHKLAMKYHPDRNPDNKEAEAKFKEAAAAYEVLSDSEKRDRYDQLGHSAYENMQQGGGAGHHGMDFDLNDIFNSMFGGGHGRSQGQRASGPTPQRGQDLAKNLSITLKEAYLGVKKDISYSHYFSCSSCKGQGAKNKSDIATCAKCHGYGQVQVQQGFFAFAQPCRECQGQGFKIKTPCPDCQGQSRRKEQEMVTVSIPKGIFHNAEVRVPGKGDAGMYGGPSGDLYLHISIEKDKKFRREEDNLVCSVMLTYPQLVFGCQINVELIDGTQESIKIPKGCPVGEKIIVPGKGFAKLRGVGAGNLIVITQCQIPKKLTDSAKDLLKNYSEAIGTETKSEDGFISSFFKKFLG